MRITLPAFALLLLLGLAFPLVAIGDETSVARPNILYFYVDDMGWGSIGPNAQAERRAKNLPAVQTPNIDRLAAQGINFARAYGCTVCSPARSSQQTGFHQGHTFADRNDPDNAKKAIRSDDITMGDALGRAGYATAYWGKWGYGGSRDMENPTLDNIQTLPTSHGYQHVLAELHHVRAHTFFQPTLWSAPTAPGTEGGLELVANSMAGFTDADQYPQTPAHQDHADYPTTAYCDDAYAFAALDFVRQQGQAYNADGKPFFGLFAAQIPHAPFDEIAKLPNWDEAYQDDPHFAKLADQSRQWAAMVTRIDAHFGNILAALEDPNHDGDTSDSVADNTLVIFMSDNGGPGGKNNGEFDANGGLRGNKGSIYEGGIRVPMVVRCPAQITASSTLKAGTSSDRVVDVTDLLPTFCELAGAEIPLGLDGVSIAPLLTGTGEQRAREFVIHEAGGSASIIRGKDKLVISRGSEKADGKKKKKKPGVGAQLYDLEADHAEENDLSDANPELVEELKALLIGERVAEPRGFANTYHQWTGKHGAHTSHQNNWSDYTYANAGITYMTDDGPPQLSWTATMTESRSARADQDVEFLALEIGGGQELVLDKGVNLTGRNEVRVSEGGILTVSGGTVSSLRWVDVLPDGTLRGSGKIDATLYQQGAVEIAVDRSFDRNALVGSFDIDGLAHLGGPLAIALDADARPRPGEQVTLLTAETIQGRFAAPNDEVVASDGTVFRIHYDARSVTATVQPPAESKSLTAR